MKRLVMTLGTLAGSMGMGTYALSFESTKVLPNGIRSLTLKTVNTTIGYKTDGGGNLDPIAKPIEKDLTFEKVVEGESGLKKTQLESFLLNEGFPLDASLGSFTADMQGRVSVVAPLFSYGLSEDLTLAVAVPYYQAEMAVDVGFMPSSYAHRFVARMHEPGYNLTESAREVADKLNDAVGELNEKLRDNGFRQLTTWKGGGIGDSTVAGKYRFMDGSILKMASTNGVVLPTGRLKDPDILNDVPFGKGTYDVFASLIADEYISQGLFLNQYAKYTYSFANSHTFRMATDDEAIEVEKRRIDYKLGDRLEAGASVQFEPDWGVVAGVGYLYSQKLADRYSVPAIVEKAKAVKEKFEADTFQRAHYVETKFGFSGVPAYRKGELAVPFSATIEYKKHLASINTFSNDFVSFDLAVYF